VGWLYCVRAKNHFSRSAALCAALLEKWFFALTDYRVWESCLSNLGFDFNVQRYPVKIDVSIAFLLLFIAVAWIIASTPFLTAFPQEWLVSQDVQWSDGDTQRRGALPSATLYHNHSAGFALKMRLPFDRLWAGGTPTPESGSFH